MSRFSQAYSNFVLSLDEVNILRASAKRLEIKFGPGKSSEINALCRGGIVLLCASLEAYIKGLGEVALDKTFASGVDRGKFPNQFFYHISKEYIKQMEDPKDPALKAQKAFDFLSHHAGYWGKSGPFTNEISADEFNSGFSTPKYEKIQQYFKRFGYQDYHRDLSRSLKGRTGLVTNFIDHLVDTRNNIAHGDLGTIKTPNDLMEISEHTKLFCRETDVAFCNWWKDSFCPIR